MLLHCSLENRKDILQNNENLQSNRHSSYISIASPELAKRQNEKIEESLIVIGI